MNLKLLTIAEAINSSRKTMDHISDLHCICTHLVVGAGVLTNRITIPTEVGDVGDWVVAAGYHGEVDGEVDLGGLCDVDL